MNRKKIKRNTYITLILWLFVIINLNYIGSFFFERIDLTSEGRYTLSPTTKQMLAGLDDYVYFTVYLEGDLNAGYKRLRNNIKEMLDEFRVIAGENIAYEFINPLEGKDNKARNEIGRQLIKKGLYPVNIQEENQDGNTSQKIIFPGALMTYKGKETAIDFFVNNIGYTAEENVNLSIQDIEYRLVKAIRELSREKKPKIAFLEGHGELEDIYIYDAVQTLSEFYSVEIIKLDGQLNSLRERIMIDSVKSKVVPRYDALIIAKPDEKFDKYDKFIIDQFIMNGGKTLWLLEGTTMDIDSLVSQGQALILPKQINLDDQLFKYGVRINPNLVQDLQCARLAVVGAQKQIRGFYWLYYPLITPPNSHPITRNMDIIKAQFVSTLEAVGNNPDVKYTYLLRTSSNTKVINSGTMVDLRILNQKPDKRQFAKANVPVAILLEGKFNSVFQNRLEPDFEAENLIAYKDKSIPTKMIVVADGDIIKNPVVRSGGMPRPLPLGSDEWLQDSYYGGNKEFILNAVNYLCDDEGIMNVRSREIKLRLMDRTKINENKSKWQTLNIVFPVIIIIIFGMILHIIRKRKYSKN